MNNSSTSNLIIIFMMVLACSLALVSKDVAQFTAVFVLVLGVSLFSYVIFRLVKAIPKLFTSKPAYISKKHTNTHKVGAVRNKRKLSGEQLIEIPAYARKAKGIAYPMTIEQLNS